MLSTEKFWSWSLRARDSQNKKGSKSKEASMDRYQKLGKIGEVRLINITHTHT